MRYTTQYSNVCVIICFVPYFSQIKSIVCLSGPTIFGGGLLSQPSSVNTRVEVVITGESEQKVCVMKYLYIIPSLVFRNAGY